MDPTDRSHPISGWPINRHPHIHAHTRTHTHTDTPRHTHMITTYNNTHRILTEQHIITHIEY